MKIRYLSSVGLILLFCFYSCYKEEIRYNSQPNQELNLPLLLQLNEKDCSFDFQSNALRYSIPNDSILNFTPFISFQSFARVSFNNQLLVNNAYNNLGKIKINVIYDIKIQIDNNVKHLSLTFTNLPIIQVVSPNYILDEPKTLARILINTPPISSKPLSSYIGLEYRGGSSQFNPKKSYGFSFLNSNNLRDKVSRSVFGFNENEDWILDAMFFDNARLRNKVSFEIWAAMGGNNHHGIHSQLVELYLNNEHLGIFCLNETINAESLLLSNQHGLLYKATAWANGATTFYTSPSPIPNKDKWDGWEQKHPKSSDYIAWSSLFDLRTLIVDKNDVDFTNQIANSIDIENCIDYYLFLNLVLAYDNSGKNTFIARQNQTAPFVIIPWDLDGSWGIFWDGSLTNTQGIITNNLYTRLMLLDVDNFKHKLKTKWFSLRNTTFSQANLLALFDLSFTQIKKAKIMPIENKKWDLKIDVQTEQDYLTSWLLDRLSFLDDYYNNL